MRKGHPLPALPSYSRSTIRNSFLPVFDPAENFKPEAPRINAKGLEGPDRSQAVSDAPQDADAREKNRVFTPLSQEDALRPPHHVKAGDASLPPFGTVGPVPVDEFWKDVQEMAVRGSSDDLRIGSIHFAPPLGPDTPVPVTRRDPQYRRLRPRHLAIKAVPLHQLPDGTVRLDATPQEIYAAARKYPGDDDHLRLHHARLQQLTPAEAEAMTTFTWGPGSSWGHPSGFFANYDEYVAARKSGYAKLRAVANPRTVKPFGQWKGEDLLSCLPGEGSAVLASLSDDVERIKACREPRTPSPDPQCSGPGYAHAPHGNCMGYSTDRT